MLRQAAAQIFGVITRVRNRLYDSGMIAGVKCSLPVISIGNIQVGGSGKTPLTILLAKELKAHARRPVILSRGYGARVLKPLLVRSDMSLAECGDEALLMASEAEVPVVVSPDRVAGAAYILQEKLGDVVLLDDGLQHRRLKRDLEIVVINVGSQSARRDIISNRLLPLGTLREDRSAALSRAGIVVLSERAPTGSGGEDSAIIDLIPRHIARFRGFFCARDIVALKDGARFDGREIVAFCAIANPEAFIATLMSLHLSLTDRIFWPDHYTFSEKDLSQLRERYPGQALVCTQKDAVRIPAHLREGIFVLRGESKVEPHDEFIARVMKSI